MCASGRYNKLGRVRHFLTLANFISIVTLFYLFAQGSGTQTGADKWNDFNVANALPSELREYRLYLKTAIDKVDTVIAQYEKMKSKRFVPISSSLPDQNSFYFKNRMGQLTEKSEAALKKELLELVPEVATQSTITVSAETTTFFESSEDVTVDNALTTTENVLTSAEINTDVMTTTPIVTDAVFETTAESIENATTEASETIETLPLDTTKESSTSINVESVTESSPTEFNQTTTEPGVTTTESSDFTPFSDIRSYPARKFAARGRSSYSGPFNPTQNRSSEECRKLSQSELVTELKQKGTYNPDLMAWDASGIFRFLDRSIVDQYERQSKAKKNNNQAVERNVDALERLLTELNLQCNVRSPNVLSKLQNLTAAEPRRTIMSPSIRMTEDEIRVKRHTVASEWIQSFNNSRLRDEFMGKRKQQLIGDVHVVPFGCDKRGEQEDGYLRLCGACQAIRKLPDTFFPPFINEVMCDEDKACLYFYDYPHGKCKQKHMNFVVLRNVGTPQCQVWQKFNLNVRVSCECFVDEMSFFAKYV